MKHAITIGIVTSAGGHYFQVRQIVRHLRNAKIIWVISPKLKLVKQLAHSTTHVAHYPESRNFFTAVRNAILAFSIFSKQQPTVLISCGAGIAVPFFLIGKIFFRTKLVFIEPIDFVTYPSLTGRIVYNFVDCFFVQKPIQLTWYPKAIYKGSLI